MSLLYLSIHLPTLSETFVYNEVFRLRARGVRVHVASVRPPDTNLGDDRLAQLASEAVPVYGTGMGRLLRDASIEAFQHPLTTIATLLSGLADALFGHDVPLSQRPKLIWQTLAGLALARRVRSLRIQHIHAHFAHVSATIAMVAARRLGIGFSFTGHANDLFQRRILLPAKLRRAKFVACISHWHRQFYHRFVPELSDDRLPIIRCGVELPSTVKPSPNHPPSILSVGRLVPKKGFDTLLAALAALQNESVEFTCTLIGDGPERRELQRLIADHHLADHVHLAGAHPHSEILAAMQTADLFVLPCKPDTAGDRDGIPVVLMEAMAAGVAVISGDLPAIRELIHPDLRHAERDGEDHPDRSLSGHAERSEASQVPIHDEPGPGATGLLVPPGDVEALAAAIHGLLADEIRRIRLAAAGRAWVEQEFSAEVNTQRLMAAFRAAHALDNHDMLVGLITTRRPVVEEAG